MGFGRSKLDVRSLETCLDPPKNEPDKLWIYGGVDAGSCGPLTVDDGRTLTRLRVALPGSNYV